MPLRKASYQAGQLLLVRVGKQVAQARVVGECERKRTHIRVHLWNLAKRAWGRTVRRLSKDNVIGFLPTIKPDGDVTDGDCTEQPGT